MNEPERVGEVETIEIVSRETSPKPKRGLAALSPEKRREIAAKGGRAAQAKNGGAHRFTSEKAREAGKKGGAAHSREHLSEIGRRGGLAVAADREHMTEIGKKGGKARAKREESQE